MGLFAEAHRLPLPDSEITYYPNFFEQDWADNCFQELLEQTPWQQDDIKVFGKVYAQPRLTALYGNNGKSYSYSNITMQPHPFSERLLEIKTAIETQTEEKFTTCLMNLYRDGKDSNGWHADDEKELGQNPVIASVSFGHERYFNLRHKNDKTQKHKLLLEHGSLLLMAGPTQHFWQHQIAKTAKKVGPRINLTFRIIR
ncbi:MAG: alpha-ketoglutarate-dependent dioxygenase AlkB [Bacteroidota bacterium]